MIQWTPGDPRPDWLEDFNQYASDQARALELGTWPTETALRERALASTLTLIVSQLMIDEVLMREDPTAPLDFPVLSSATLRLIANHVTSAILAGSWLQSQRALEYLDNHPNRNK